MSYRNKAHKKLKDKPVRKIIECMDQGDAAYHNQCILQNYKGNKFKLSLAVWLYKCKLRLSMSPFIKWQSYLILQNCLYNKWIIFMQYLSHINSKKYFLSTCYVADIIINTGNTAVNELNNGSKRLLEAKGAREGWCPSAQGVLATASARYSQCRHYLSGRQGWVLPNIPPSFFPSFPWLSKVPYDW